MRAVCLVFVGVLLGTTGKARALELAACGAPGFEEVLNKQSTFAPADARAYWLDRATLQWPGVQGGGNYRLYHAPDAGISAIPGQPVAGAQGHLPLSPREAELPAAIATRFAFIGNGVKLSVAAQELSRVPELLRQQVLLVREDATGKVLEATGVQLPGALDDLYAAAEAEQALGATPVAGKTGFRLWAPTARTVSLCLHADGDGRATSRQGMHRDDKTGIWSATLKEDLSGHYYTYLVEVFVPGVGMVRNRVTDPYSVSLTTDSLRSYIADLDAPALKPDGWEQAPFPVKVAAQTDMSIYELHVRDFSIGDTTVSAANRGKYLSFTETDSNGMRHLAALSAAGLTDVHLLPVFDFATVPESGCVTPNVPDAAPDSLQQQAAVMAVAAQDCFNWGYDPYHFNAPEGSYASDAEDGAIRIREFRSMVMALHRAGLRVGMDVVYNHTTTSGQAQSSVLDRIVPGYYQRLDGNGVVERSTCCANTATEHLMMGKLMSDSVALWATRYKIDSFRFDLMGHQPRAVMEALGRRVDAATGRRVNLIGEGWNFGEVADGSRFVQASQLSLNGSGIGTFSDRARDALRGGGPSDSGKALVERKGWLNGLGNDRDAPGAAAALAQAAELVRVGLAGSLRDYALANGQGKPVLLSGIDYHGQPAGYASQPGEVVNYVENHDNQTLFDSNVYKLPVQTSAAERARVQVLALAVNAFSQGVAYFHAGVDTLRSKSMDRNSFDSGDWFNRLDWTYRDNHFATGLPPARENEANFPFIAPLLREAGIKPAPADIAWTRDAFRDLLRLRASSTLFRMRSARDIQQRLTFPKAVGEENPLLITGHVQGQGYPGANFKEILYLLNADTQARSVELPSERGKHYVLHPVHRDAQAADLRAKQARYDMATGRFTVPARTAVVYVLEQ